MGLSFVTGAQRSGVRSSAAQSNGDCSGKYAAAVVASTAQEAVLLAGLVDTCAKA
jgi:hypothetical protein